MQQWLRKGSKGPDVVKWQTFLRGSLKNVAVITDGDFGPGTEAATKTFQLANKLTADGVVGDATLIAAAKKGYQLAHDASGDKSGPNWPAKPSDVRQLTPAERATLFGTFAYTAAPTTSNPEGIKITDGWDKKNITYVTVDQITKADGRSLKVGVHVKVEKQFRALWKAWEDAGLLDKVETFNGGYVSRFIRGSDTSLSNHSWGTAFDINVPWNALGTKGALVGEKGSVRELVEIALQHGYFWGGWFYNPSTKTGRADPMHFEVFKIVVQ